MDAALLLTLSLAVAAYGLVSARAGRRAITPPMAFTALGVAVGSSGLGILPSSIGHEALHLVAELALVLVLFGDASRIDLGALRREHDLPLRLLLLGIPLTVVAGTLVGLLILPGIGLWGAALLAALLAPTDVSLSEAVLEDERVPGRVRQALNVESGLNDGLVLPLVLIFFTLACAQEAPGSWGYWVRFGVLQTTLGPLVGAAIGWGGGRLADRAAAAERSLPAFRELIPVALAIASFAGAELIGGNGFMAAYCAGMLLGNTARTASTVHGFMFAEGQLLVLAVFLLFGASLVPAALAVASAPVLVYVAASLTVVRMLPVASSLLGKRLQPRTTLFLGWFGPRGLASVLFALFLTRGMGSGRHEELVGIASLAVLTSVFAHGLSAVPAGAAYGDRIGELTDAVEHRPVPPMSTRLRSAT